MKGYYPHSIGHYLGMDVHDVHDISSASILPPWTIITIEPGLYIPDEEGIPEQYRGIGIRIEDDILITERGYENLSETAPRAMEKVEETMKMKSKFNPAK